MAGKLNMQTPKLIAAALADALSRAERPCLFSARDGSLLRLVAPNERLSREELEHHLHQLLHQKHMQQLLVEHVDSCHLGKRKLHASTQSS